MAKKYIKNEKGIVRAVTSDNLQLEKPLLNENYDIEVHNRNMDKIDKSIQEVKSKIDGLELIASNVKMNKGTTVEDEVTNNTNIANQALEKADEAFQRGDNVKTQLVDKLISEGLDVSTNNTFEELIESIKLSGKWASGQGVSSKVLANFGSLQYYYLDIPILDFEPKFIILHNNPQYASITSTYVDIKGTKAFITPNATCVGIKDYYKMPTRDTRTSYYWTAIG